jgi:ankyrin repeat protein
MPPHLCELLDEGRSKEFEGYHGDLLFGMALSKATARLQGFREDVKTLIRKAASATPASIRAKGIFKQIEAAISYQASEEEAGSMSFASLYEVAATGSIIARSEIQKTDPDAAEQSSLEFRCRGGYNRESVASKSEYTEIKRRIALDASSNGRLHSNECEYSPEFHDVDNMEFSFGNSLLHVAAAFGVCDAISELASQEHLDLDPRNFLGETPLYKACMAGQHEAAIMLLDLGANPCIRVGRTQVSCLHWLFTFGPSHMYQITEKLTSCGLKADEIATPIVSVQGQDQFVFEEAIHYPFHWPIGTPLHWAAHMENVDAVNHLKAIGVDVDVLDMPGDEQAQTALSMAMYRGSATMVKHLLSLGASPTRADGRGRTPLHMLAGDSWIQNRLFKIPSNLQQWCQHGHFNVCLKDLKDCVEAVKDFGAPLDGPRHRSNRTPLADAVEDKNVCAVIALLDSGADANKCQDRSGRTSLHLWLMVEPNKLAYPEGYFLALEKLIHATTIDTTLLPVIMSDVIQCDSTSWRQKLSTFEKLSAHTIDINLQDGSGKTLLMTCVEYAASSRDCLKGVRWMLERGAAVAMRDNHGRDLLWYAAHNREIGDEGCLEILKLYLECASETSKAMVLNQSKDSASGKTALMAMCSRCYYSSVRLAIQTGVDLNDHDRDGVTALDLTLETGNSIRLALWDSYLTRYRRLPTRSDNISDDMFQRVAFGDSSNQSRTSNNKVGTHKILYMTFPKLARCLIEAGAQTGQQLQYRSAAPDIKYRERLFLEENGIEDFVVEDQPYYHLWQEWYQYDNTTKNEDEAMEVQRKGWSIPLEIRKQLEREQAEVKSSSSR